MIKLSWYRSPKGYAFKGDKIAPLSKQQNRYEFPSENDEICQRFADIGNDRDVALKFASEYGLLTGWEGERFTLWSNQINAFHDVLEAAEAGRQDKVALRFAEAQHVRDVSPFFERGTSGLEMILMPKTLISALWMQLGLLITGPAEIKSCKNCGRLFAAGGGIKARKVAERSRSSRVYCSQDCKIAFNNREMLKRRKERQQ